MQATHPVVPCRAPWPAADSKPLLGVGAAELRAVRRWMSGKPAQARPAVVLIDENHTRACPCVQRRRWREIPVEHQVAVQRRRRVTPGKTVAFGGRYGDDFFASGGSQQPSPEVSLRWRGHVAVMTRGPLTVQALLAMSSSYLWAS